MATAHAKNRAPSAAKRWLSCPYSALVTPMYPNDPTDASIKGDHWHELMEDQITFGTLPKTVDPDAAEAMEYLYEYVLKRVSEMGGPGKVKIYVEQQLDIPETGEFGTGDIILVSDKEIEIIDEKSGYVPVKVRLNAQLMCYLLGAIARFGTRGKYKLTLHQPNYDHIDGTLRSDDVTDKDIEWFRDQVAYSVKYENECKAGKHCKETYCPHRGTCEPFMQYVQKDLILGWHTSEIKSVSDEQLAIALDAADELSGWRNELRAEGMRRIMNLDRKIDGYKVVKGRKQRAVLNPLALINAVAEQMGGLWAVKLFPDLDHYLSHLTDFPMKADSKALKFLGTPKHIEDVIKVYAREHSLPRGGWKAVYDNVVGQFIRETASGLTLERAIDGRPAHKRGSEFGSLVPASSQDVTII